MKFEQTELLLVSGLFENSLKTLKSTKEEVVDIVRLTGDASTRRYYRLKSSLRSYVVCIDDPFASPHEYPFYVVQQGLLANNVRVPLIYDCSPEKGYLLEEDLGDETFLRRMALVQNKKEENEWYCKAIDLMVKIHQIPSTRPEIQQVAKQSFDKQKLLMECDFAIKHFVQGILGVSDTGVIEMLRSSMDFLSTYLGEREKVPTHRDYHSRNLMVTGSELVVIDFQDARMGMPQYDLVSLIEDCYYSLDIDHKNDLINYYLGKMKPNPAIPENSEIFFRDYSIMKIQRLFKAIGSFSFIFNQRKDSRYLKYIGGAMENMKGDLFKIDELQEFRKQLYSIYYAS